MLKGRVVLLALLLLYKSINISYSLQAKTHDRHQTHFLGLSPKMKIMKKFKFLRKTIASFATLLS